MIPEQPARPGGLGDAVAGAHKVSRAIVAKIMPLVKCRPDGQGKPAGPKTSRPRLIFPPVHSIDTVQHLVLPPGLFDRFDN